VTAADRSGGAHRPRKNGPPEEAVTGATAHAGAPALCVRVSARTPDQAWKQARSPGRPAPAWGKTPGCAPLDRGEQYVPGRVSGGKWPPAVCCAEPRPAVAGRITTSVPSPADTASQDGRNAGRVRMWCKHDGKQARSARQRDGRGQQACASLWVSPPSAVGVVFPLAPSPRAAVGVGGEIRQPVPPLAHMVFTWSSQGRGGLREGCERLPGVGGRRQKQSHRG